MRQSIDTNHEIKQNSWLCDCVLPFCLQLHQTASDSKAHTCLGDYVKAQISQLLLFFERWRALINFTVTKTLIHSQAWQQSGQSKVIQFTPE